MQFRLERGDADEALALRAERSFAGEVCWWDISAEKLSAIGLTEEDLEPVTVAAEQAFEVATAALLV